MIRRLLAAFSLLALVSLSMAGCKKRPGPLVDEQEEKKAPKKDATVEEPPADGTEPIPRGCKVELVQAAVKPHRTAATQCYRKALSRNKAAAGRLSVEIHLSRAGKARFLGVKDDDFKDEAFTKCLFDVLRPIQYPLPEDEQCVVVYPFTFSAGAPRP